jgi:hypothetical protein
MTRQHRKALFAAIVLAFAELAATSAIAQPKGIPGIGIVVKRQSGNSAIIAPSDSNGAVRLTGLQPGQYSVRVLKELAETVMRVGRDGRLAFVAREDYSRPDPNAVDPRARRALPVVRRWAEQITFGKETPTDAVVIDVRNAMRFFPTPCAPPPPGKRGACGTARNHIDINASPAGEIVRHAPGLSLQTAEAIVAERARNGRFTGIEDFSRRLCPSAEVDFGQAPVRFGDQVFILSLPVSAKGSVPGFRCAPGDNMFRLYAAWHSYASHTNLLR